MSGRQSTRTQLFFSLLPLCIPYFSETCKFWEYASRLGDRFNSCLNCTFWHCILMHYWCNFFPIERITVFSLGFWISPGRVSQSVNISACCQSFLVVHVLKKANSSMKHLHLSRSLPELNRTMENYFMKYKYSSSQSPPENYIYLYIHTHIYKMSLVEKFTSMLIMQGV